MRRAARRTNPTADVGNLSPVLEVLLNDASSIALSAKDAHWNVKGPSFMGLHELFDKIHAAAEEYADQLAERLAQFGKRAVARPSSSDISGDQKAASGAEYAVSMASELAIFSGRLGEVAELADKAGDAVTLDILSEIQRGVDKWRWMVESHLEVKGAVFNPGPSRVTFGKMIKADPSAASMDVMLDGRHVGSIDAEYRDVSASRTRDYRVEAYLVDIEGVAEQPVFWVRDSRTGARGALARAKEWATEKLLASDEGRPARSNPIRNMDDDLRAAERAHAAEGSVETANTLACALERVGRADEAVDVRIGALERAGRQAEADAAALAAGRDVTFSVRNKPGDYPYSGREFVVRITHSPPGGKYKGHEDEVHVAFHDATYRNDRRFAPHGQLVSSYFGSTVLEGGRKRALLGLDLVGYEPVWKLDGAAYAQAYDRLSALADIGVGCRKFGK